MAAVPAMNRSTITSGLAAWLTSVTGLSVHNLESSQQLGATWGTSPKNAHIEQFLKVAEALGSDEIRRTYDSEADQVDVSIEGQRILTWEIRVEAFSQTAGSDAHGYLDTVRAKLRGPAAIETLRALGVGVTQVGMPQDLTLTQDQRRLSRAQIDVRLAAYSAVADDPIQFIETIVINSDYLGPDGVRLPAKAQLVDEEFTAP